MNTAHTAAARPRRPSLLAAAALAALLLVACEQPGQSAAVPAASTAQPPVPAPQQEEEQLPPWDEDLPAEPAQETTQLWDGVPPLRATGALHNFGSSTAAWLRKMRHLARGNNADIPKSGAPEVLRILVLGDSHTAGGYLTDALRQRLQARLGAAGPGWAQPIQIRGQNTTTIETNGWLASNSRDNAGAQEDTLGGVTTCEFTTQYYTVLSEFEPSERNRQFDGKSFSGRFLMETGFDAPLSRQFASRVIRLKKK